MFSHAMGYNLCMPLEERKHGLVEIAASLDQVILIVAAARVSGTIPRNATTRFVFAVPVGRATCNVGIDAAIEGSSCRAPYKAEPTNITARIEDPVWFCGEGGFMFSSEPFLSFFNGDTFGVSSHS